MSRLVFAGMPVTGPTCWPSLGVVNGCAAKLRFQMHFKDLLLRLMVGLILCLCVAMCRCVGGVSGDSRDCGMPWSWSYMLLNVHDMN